MNKVFEHVGDLVNIKVAHNLMRLIAEGFGEDDDTADSQLRSSAVWAPFEFNFNFLSQFLVALYVVTCILTTSLWLKSIGIEFYNHGFCALC